MWTRTLHVNYEFYRHLRVSIGSYRNLLNNSRSFESINYPFDFFNRARSLSLSLSLENIGIALAAVGAATSWLQLLEFFRHLPSFYQDVHWVSIVISLTGSNPRRSEFFFFFFSFFCLPWLCYLLCECFRHKRNRDRASKMRDLITSEYIVTWAPFLLSPSIGMVYLIL